MSNYKCGRCSYSCDDLREFGAHPCTGANPILAALSAISPEFRIDIARAVRDNIEKHKVEAAVDRLENALREGQL